MEGLISGFNLRKELTKRGIDGNGEMEKGLKVSEFEAFSGAKLNKDGENCCVTLIDEECNDFTLTLEIKNEVITHSYY